MGSRLGYCWHAHWSLSEIRQECQSIRFLLQRVHKQENNKQSKHIRWPITDLTSHSRPLLDPTLKSSIRKVSLRKERMKERRRKGQRKINRLGEERKTKKNDDRRIWPFSVLHFESSIPDRGPRQSHFDFLPVFERWRSQTNTESTLFYKIRTFCLMNYEIKYVMTANRLQKDERQSCACFLYPGSGTCPAFRLPPRTKYSFSLK